MAYSEVAREESRIVPESATGHSRRFGRVATTSGLASAADVADAIAIFAVGPGGDIRPDIFGQVFLFQFIATQTGRSAPYRQRRHSPRGPAARRPSAPLSKTFFAWDVQPTGPRVQLSPESGLTLTS